MPSVLAAARQVTPKLSGYVRGVLDLLNLDADARARLARMSLLGITPFRVAMKGVLTGDVTDAHQLGLDGDPYPRIDPHTTVDDLNYTADGRPTMTPRNTYNARIASGVQFTLQELALAVGLNDPAEFEATAPEVHDD